MPTLRTHLARPFAVLLLTITALFAAVPASWARDGGSPSFTDGSSRDDESPSFTDGSSRDDEAPILTVLEPQPNRIDSSLTTRRGGRSSNGTSGATSGDDKIKYGSGCEVACITSGVAYGYQAGAELVVTTDTPAQIQIFVWGHGYYGWQTSAPGQYEFAVLFDDLEAGTTYSARATVWDAAGKKQVAEGAFTTLNRHVEVKLPIVELINTPWSSSQFSVFHWANGTYHNTFTPSNVDKVGQFLVLGGPNSVTTPEFTISEVDRHLDLRVGVLQWGGSGKGECEPLDWTNEPDPSYPAMNDCFASAVATAASPIDLDDPLHSFSPVEHHIATTLSVPHDSPFPPMLDFSVPAFIDVTYS